MEAEYFEALAGRAGVYFHPSHIAGDGYRVRATLRFKKCPGYDFPNLEVLARRYPLDLGGSTVPEHLLARYRPDGSDAQVMLVWAETAGGAVAIYRRLDPAEDPGAGGERELLLKRPGPLLAMELLPVGGESVDALFGPAGTSGKYSYLRIPLAGGEPAIERSFDAPAGNADGWAIAGLRADGFAVIGYLGSVIKRSFSEQLLMRPWPRKSN